jgi:hypothetical protein
MPRRVTVDDAESAPPPPAIVDVEPGTVVEVVVDEMSTEVDVTATVVGTAVVADVAPFPPPPPQAPKTRATNTATVILTDAQVFS